MLSRGFYDVLAIWPVAVWPVVFSSAFWGFIRLCQVSRARYGFSALNGDRWGHALARWLYLPMAGLFEVTIHGYLLWVIGWTYLTAAIPIYVLGWMVLPALLDDFAPGLVLLPASHLLFAAAFLVLLGFADVGLLRAIHSELYSLLIGVRVAI